MAGVAKRARRMKAEEVRIVDCSKAFEQEGLRD